MTEIQKTIIGKDRHNGSDSGTFTVTGFYIDDIIYSEKVIYTGLEYKTTNNIRYSLDLNENYIIQNFNQLEQRLSYPEKNNIKYPFTLHKLLHKFFESVESVSKNINGVCMGGETNQMFYMNVPCNIIDELKSSNGSFQLTFRIDQDSNGHYSGNKITILLKKHTQQINIMQQYIQDLEDKIQILKPNNIDIIMR